MPSNYTNENQLLISICQINRIDAIGSHSIRRAQFRSNKFENKFIRSKVLSLFENGSSTKIDTK